MPAAAPLPPAPPPHPDCRCGPPLPALVGCAGLPWSRCVCVCACIGRSEQRWQRGRTCIELQSAAGNTARCCPPCYRPLQDKAYPGWAPDPSSSIVQVTKEAIGRVTGACCAVAVVTMMVVARLLRRRDCFVGADGSVPCGVEPLQAPPLWSRQSTRGWSAASSARSCRAWSASAMGPPSGGRVRVWVGA